MGSFKLKLAAYFTLVALLPPAAAAGAFGLASRHEPREQPARRLAATAPAAVEAQAVVEWRYLLALVIVVFLVAFVAYLEGRAIVRRLRQLVEAARGLAQGQLDERVPVRGTDELAQVGRAFNEMAEQLEARLHELEAERVRLRDATLRLGEALAATHDIGELLRVIVESAVESTGARGGVFIGSMGDRVEAGDPSAGRERLELPLTAEREHFGALILSGDEFSQEQRETAAWLVGHAVIGLHNAHLHRTVERQALLDPLTGLANRRLAEGALEKELSRAERFREPLALVLCDLDDFKSINDHWGHPFGDEVLRRFADTLQQSIREIDLAGRWGGEEFALLLPSTDLEGGVEAAERIRTALAELSIRAPSGKRVPLTATFGVAAFAEAATRRSMVEAADAALYEAKRAGKDRVGAAANPIPQ